MHAIIVGAGRVGRDLAQRLEDRGETVVLIEKDEAKVDAVRSEGFTVHHGDGADVEGLQEAGVDRASIVAAVTGDDDANLLAVQLTESNYDVETVLARCNKPENVPAFEELGVRAIAANEATAWAMDNAIERPALYEWMTQIEDGGDVQEVEVTADDLVGTKISDLDAQLPEGVIIALVGRDGNSQIPKEDLTLQRGDHLTFVGRHDPVREAIRRFDPELHG